MTRYIVWNNLLNEEISRSYDETSAETALNYWQFEFGKENVKFITKPIENRSKID